MHIRPNRTRALLEARFQVLESLCNPLTGVRGLHVQVLQRGLPRPLAQTMTPDPLPAGPVGPSPAEAAEALLAAEVNALLQHEAVAHPVRKRKRGPGELSRAGSSPSTMVVDESRCWLRVGLSH